MIFFAFILPVSVLLAPAQAWIYARAFMYGCVSYAETPTEAIKVDFKVGIGGTQCMDATGSDGSIIVTKGGVTCYEIGDVENKPYDTGLDNCVVRPSYWGASYSTNTSQSGSTSSWWTANYHGADYCYMELEHQVAGTDVCGSAALCEQTSHDWSYGTTPTFYLIFQPEKNAGTKGDTNVVVVKSGVSCEDHAAESDEVPSAFKHFKNFRQLFIG